MTIFEPEGPAKDLYQELRRSQEHQLLLALASISLMKGGDLTPISILYLFNRGLEKKWYRALKEIWSLEKVSLRKLKGVSSPIMIASLDLESGQRKIDHLRKKNLGQEFLCIALTSKSISRGSV